MINEIIKNMPNKDYHASPGISNSRMGYLLDCPARYYTEFLDPNKPEKKKPEAFSLGTAVHSLVLEPDKFFEDNYVFPKCDRRTNKGKDDFEEHTKQSKGKNLLNDEQFEKAHAMATSVFKRIPWLKTILQGASIEDSLFWVDEDTGVQLRSRPDIYNGDFYIDLKTSESAKQEDFTRSIVKYGYDRQASLARAGLMKFYGKHYKYFINVVVEEDYPHLCAAYVMDDAMLDRGEAQYKRATQIYKECVEKNEWKGYSPEIQQVYLPPWLK